MAATLNLGNGNWGVKENSLLAYNSENGNFKPLPFDFTRASSATVVNKQGLIETVQSGIPRIDFKDDAKGALLLEPQSTNLITYSEDFSQSAWFKTGLSVNSNQIISPDGTLNADEVNISAANAHYLFDSISVSALTNYTFTFYVKKGTATDVSYSILNEINFTNIVNTTSYFNEISDTEWTRISVEFTTPSGCTSIRTYPLRDGLSIGTVYIWGAMLEQGSYATSYIPTQGAISTRNQDIANNSGIGSLIGQTEGTIFLDFKVLSEDEINANIFNTNKNTANAIAVIRLKSVEKIQVQTFFNSVNENYLATNTCDIGDRIKLAFKYKSGDIKFYINGVLENQSTSTFTISSSLSEINLADNVTYFARKEAIDFTALAVYKTALTDAQLQDLTTL